MNLGFVYSCDNIIDFWKNKDRRNKFNQIINCEKIPKDTTCTRNALTKYNFFTRNQKCFNCTLLSSFFSNDLVNNVPIEIMAGKYRGDYLITNIESSVDDSYQLLEFDYINKLFDQDDSLYYYATKDENLNYACINILMYQI